jgi:hypothetical protein
LCCHLAAENKYKKSDERRCISRINAQKAQNKVFINTREREREKEKRRKEKSMKFKTRKNVKIDQSFIFKFCDEKNCTAESNVFFCHTPVKLIFRETKAERS